MKAFGSAEWISFVPGNHDTYVRNDWQHGLAYLSDYMQGDMKVKFTQVTPQITTPFPYVRLRRNVALIGLSTAVPQPLHRASGILGPTQLDSLEILLNDLRERGFARIVMIHHPPLPGLASPRKALIDAGQLRNVLEAQGAELVLHGHNHEHMQNTLATRFGKVNILGVPSASMVNSEHHPLAGWNFYRIQRQNGRWITDLTVRGLDKDSRRLVTLGEYTLST
jgi:3',5'-cyclic AMP phosphodiesterase CpdA